MPTRERGAHHMRVLLFRDSRGQWQWRLTSLANGKIVGGSTEGYRRRAMAVENLLLVTGIDAEIWIRGERFQQWTAHVTPLGRLITSPSQS